eukprot:TRINITY_DN15319_c0_g1_i1.p1 TRINITY_DN15319_c0_g1~~TRINITY_DN15319_c0_g1_i1.p1  ORF type:complete len:152 (+),score=19.79 TRINITY_DN15319_c0_g1_i1:315-770(+)
MSTAVPVNVSAELAEDLPCDDNDLPALFLVLVSCGCSDILKANPKQFVRESSWKETNEDCWITSSDQAVVLLEIVDLQQTCADDVQERVDRCRSVCTRNFVFVCVVDREYVSLSVRFFEPAHTQWWFDLSGRTKLNATRLCQSFVVWSRCL